MAGTFKRLGPTALTTTMTTNVYNQSSPLIYDLITRVEITNKTAAPVTFSLWIGATGANAAGTEWYSGVSVPANSTIAYTMTKKITSTDFIVGGASANASLVIQFESQQFVV